MTEIPLQRPDFHERDAQQSFGAFELNRSQVAEVQSIRHEYLAERDLLDESAMQSDGFTTDVYADRSIWLAIRTLDNESLQSAGRIILPENNDILSLQMSLMNIRNPDKELVGHILAQQSNTVAEVASMLQVGNDPWANLRLYGALHNASLDRGIRYWLFGLRHRSQEKFEKVLGPALTPLGDGVTIKGAKEELLPYLIDLGPGVAEIRQSLDDENLDRFTRLTRKVLIDSIDSLKVRPQDSELLASA